MFAPLVNRKFQNTPEGLGLLRNLTNPGIRKVKFAARDSIAGATALNKAIDYIKSKNIFVEVPFNELELVQIVIQTCFAISKRRNAERVINMWSAYCPKGVEIGRHLYEHDILNELVKQETDVSVVYDSILNY